MSQVRTWAIHRGGPRIVSELEQMLDLPPGATAASREILSRCGNMSSATILFVLQRLRQTNAELPCVALSFGPGPMAEVALIS
jgi:predicted naringenin-chalcone synthase